MRLVPHVVAACLLTVFVAVSAADKASENSVLRPPDVQPSEKPEAAEVTPQNVPETVQQKQESNRTEEPKPVQQEPVEVKPEDKRKEENEEPKPTETNISEGQRIQKPDEGEQTDKVTYTGAKVLRVVIQNKDQKKMIRQLENKGDIDTWFGNGTAIDILIRRDSVFNLLKDKNLIYDVVIDDLQKAIEEENPPIPQDEWSELEGRKVEPYSQRIVNGFLSPFRYWLPQDFSTFVDRNDYGDPHVHGFRKTKRKKKKKKRRRGHRMTWQMYHRMNDIHGYIDYLTATYPDICSQETIGHSIEGRPLKVLKISSGESNGRAMWVDSGIHAREWITPATSTYIINQMVENGDGTHGVDWYFLPLVNPDGYEHSHTTDRLWRKNRANAHKGPCAGTDLNRNFGYRWGGPGSSQQPCRETYAGSGPFSEPETSAINKFVLNKSRDLKAYVSLHSYGQYILYPWGYDRKVPPDYSDLHRVGRAMAQAMRTSGGQIYRVGSAAATLYPAAGGSDDWAKGTAKIKYTYTIELRDTGRHGFILPAQYIQPTAKEAYAALKTLASEVIQL